MMHDDALPTRRGMKLRWRLLLSALFFGPAIYFAVDGDYVVAAMFAVTGFSAFTGYRAGLVNIFAFLAAITAAIAFTPSLALMQEDRFAAWFGTTGLTNRLLTFGVIGISISLIVSTTLMYVGGRILRRRSVLTAFNKWLGFGIGAIEGVVVMLFFLGGMLMIEPAERRRAPRRDPTDRRGQIVSKLILSTAQQTRESRLGPTIERYNPFTLFPQLNRVDELQNSVEVLSDPVKVSDFLDHPSIQELKQTPEVREAVDKITQDADVKAFLESGKPMDMELAKTLLNHPALIELIDHPGFLDQASEAIKSSNVLGNAR
ncbi:MAG: CvpA family protein, partial [Rubripirellula sp.]